MRARLAAVVAVSAFALAACGGSDAAEDPNAPISVAVSPQPHGEILEYVDRELAPKAGIDLEIEKFDDYNRPNEAVANGEIDANYFQHIPYLDQYKSERGGDLVWVEPVHLEPLAVYSKQFKSVQELPNGATVTLSNDPANQFRGLKLLETNGLVKLKPEAAVGTRLDAAIAENPKNIQFKDLSPDQLPRSVDDAAAAVVNGNYALKANLENPIAVESAQDNPYANGLVTSSKLVQDPRIKKLAEILRSPEVKDYINRTYGGVGVTPAS
ncbi:MetQ/NlpA family ABC transporter substrate-binding protein [Saccharopolyspora erythraea]|uniref:MetQ/NlpA family ABC transporter substrate-binding protein n=1 Tax=Saccharopolyspora erythraea TaxID=1836 RepID=UPI001BA5DBF0|nr:MetQ/NlpA family ABC transporter substrate-binding protein [Saccharopolyspora erythraea]QUH00117.1 MetQ/NlpA family ABC transporter substrate-binding protein [Saccharopolyspora erythraea]